MTRPIRTRIAPSPTGEDLHIGNAYTALINFVFAKKHKGQFIIRIEDTDQTRLVKGSEERIIASLAWLGITHDEGPDKAGPYQPYRQSERLPIYKQYAEELIANDHAYYCFCTSERLTQMRKDQETRHEPPMYDGLCRTVDKQTALKRIKNGESYTIRLRVPKEGTTSFTDVIRGEIIFENKLIDDQVLLKSDGYPTYHLGVVVDDHIMEISHIIRGEEWISSTPKHILLYKFFNWDVPMYAHMPLLRNPDKSKLSKRKNPVWLSYFKHLGVLPEAMRNYLALLAWSYPDGRDMFTTNEMIEVFDVSQIKTTAPIFDMDRLRWMNGEYLRKKTEEEMEKLLSEWHNFKPQEKKMLPQIIPLIKDRMKYLSEFKKLAGFFFEAPKEFEKSITKEHVTLLKNVLNSIAWNHDALEKSIRQTAENANIKPKDLFMELRLTTTGKTVGPPLLESLVVLGKNETMARLNNALS